MKKNIKIFNYAGTKFKYVDVINNKINDTTKQIYVEPFLGSGAVFLNLEKQFDEYYLNDINRNVIRIFESFKNSDYTLLQACLEEINIRFGDIKNNKESFYNFRNQFNKYIWNTNTEAEGFYLYILYMSCLNNMPRFGPNGFNQSFGNRLKICNDTEFHQIKNKLQNTTITNLDFFTFIETIQDKLQNCLLFLDPPYFYKQTGNYNQIDQKFNTDFLKFCNDSKCDIVYTDTEHGCIDWEYEILRTMQNISPNRKEEYTINEVVYKNF